MLHTQKDIHVQSKYVMIGEVDCSLLKNKPWCEGFMAFNISELNYPIIGYSYGNEPFKHYNGSMEYPTLTRFLNEYFERSCARNKRWCDAEEEELLKQWKPLTLRDKLVVHAEIMEATKQVVHSFESYRDHIQKEFKDIEVIGGNVATPEGALELVKSGVDSVKIGMGPGSICTTRIIAGIGVPQITAIMDIKNALKGKDVSIIADGGIRFSGDIAKAIAAGADSVMLGGLFAGTEEAPGEVELFQGRSFKIYRGMGSIGAMTERDDANRYSQEDVCLLYTSPSPRD